MNPEINELFAKAAACQRKISALNASIKQEEILFLRDRRAIGLLLLEIKKLLPHGEFLKALAKMGIPHRRANECMEIANMDQAVFDQCKSIRQALLMSQNHNTKGIQS